MRTLRGTRTLTLWAALLAVLMAALAPSVSHALAVTAGAAWIDVCTGDSTKADGLASDDANGSTAPGSTGTAFEHCGYCSFHAQQPAVAAAPAAAFAAPDVVQPTPATVLAAVRGVTAWHGAQPRAPPQAS